MILALDIGSSSAPRHALRRCRRGGARRLAAARVPRAGHRGRRRGARCAAPARGRGIVHRRGAPGGPRRRGRRPLHVLARPPRLRRAGRPATPLYMYSDTRSAGQAAALGRRLDEAAVAGAHRLPPAHVLLAGEAPMARGGPVHGPPGAVGLHRRAASPPSGWAAPSPASRSPRRPASSIRSVRAGIPRCSTRQASTSGSLFPLAELDQGLTLGEPWASRWPELKRAAWYPAIGDGAAGSVGSGCTDRTRVAINVGTSSAMRIVTDVPRWRRRGGCGATGSTRAAPSRAGPCPRAATCTRGAPARSTSASRTRSSGR